MKLPGLNSRAAAFRAREEPSDARRICNGGSGVCSVDEATASVLALNTDPKDGRAAEVDREPKMNGFANGFNESFLAETLPDV